MSEIVVYGHAMSPFARPVLLALEEKGVPYRVEMPELGSAAHRALHPWAKLPALTHGGVTLHESVAIAHYVDEAFPGVALRPADPLGRAQVLQWISAAQDYGYEHVVAGHLMPYFMEQYRGMPVDTAAVEAALPAMRSTVAVFERALAGRSYLVGDQVSLADLFLAPMLAMLGVISPAGKAVMADSPNLAAWLERLAARDSFRRTQASA